MFRRSFLCLALVFLLSPSVFADASVRLKISVADQKLYLLKNDRVVKNYPVSTSKYGTGNREGSFKTPLGRHRVARKIGAGAPLGTIFKERRNTGETIRPSLSKAPVPGDYVTTRILWLEGLEPGKNRGGEVDSFKRYIYIHGTPDEGLIGTPASHGCIRLKNEDAADLFERVPFGTRVDIV